MPLCSVTAADRTASHSDSGRCNVGDDEIIVLQKLFEKEIFEEIVKINAIRPVTFKMAMKVGSRAELSTFSK